jgi:large subunit ribosomal protein L23
MKKMKTYKIKNQVAETNSTKQEVVLLAPLATEKCIRLIESDNVLSFIVGKKANKNMVKLAVEKEFKVKVARVNIQNSVDGRKKAYVRLASSHLAADVSADLGFI